MAEKRIQMWQESPAQELRNQRTELKLRLRKEKLNEILMSKRNICNPIKGYNLSLCKKKYYYHKKYKNKSKRCWYCGSKNHIKLDCPVLKENQLWSLLTELEQRISEIEEELHIQKKNRLKRERKIEKQKVKKQKKKHLQVIKAMNKAVSIKLLLDKDEEKGLQEGTPKYLTQAMTLHKNLGPKERILLEKEYQKLFGESLKEQILDALDMDEIIQQFNEEEDFSMDIQNG